jgi:alpha-tubulin suppressor-like RCC1 family protein
LAAALSLAGCQLIGSIHDKDLQLEAPDSGDTAGAGGGDPSGGGAAGGGGSGGSGGTVNIVDASSDQMTPEDRTMTGDAPDALVASERGSDDARPVDARPVDARPVDAPPGGGLHISTAKFTQISAMGNRTCGIKTVDSSIVCWGEAPNPVPAGAFKQVSSGGLHTCGLTAAGAVLCAGNSINGQTTAPSGVFDVIASGNAHSCARVAVSGAVMCWGDNRYGQATMPPSNYADVAAGADRTCVIGFDHVVNCWGARMSGQVNPQGKFTQISVGDQQSCGVRSDIAAVSCWNDLGSNMAPLQRAGDYLQASTGLSHVCAVSRTGGVVTCWGSNLLGESQAPTSGTFTQVTTGYSHSCALMATGFVACWGDNTMGQATPP